MSSIFKVLLCTVNLLSKLPHYLLTYWSVNLLTISGTKRLLGWGWLSWNEMLQVITEALLRRWWRQCHWSSRVRSPTTIVAASSSAHCRTLCMALNLSLTDQSASRHHAFLKSLYLRFHFTAYP